MSSSRLDQVVKGAPPPGTSIPAVLEATASRTVDGNEETKSDPIPSNEISAGKAPARTKTRENDHKLAAATSTSASTASYSDPDQIYINLLILEASLRAQFLTLRDRRRQNDFFLSVLAAWILGFGYLLFLRPREDGSGIGGSVYWVIETAEKVALLGGIITGILMWGSGQWDRGVRWPRRWLGITNRGLRSMNAKLVVDSGPWWRRCPECLHFFIPYSFFFPTDPAAKAFQHSPTYSSTSFRSSANRIYEYTEADSVKHKGQDEEDAASLAAGDEDLSPGGDHVRLLLLPRPFSPEFRDQWHIYRLDYWERENERRAHLRRIFKAKAKQQCHRQRKWLWWTGLRYPTLSSSSSSSFNPGKHISVITVSSHSNNKMHHPTSHQKRRESKSRMSVAPSHQAGSQSKGSSRSTTPSISEGHANTHESRASGSHNTRTNRARRGSLATIVSGADSSSTTNNPTKPVTSRRRSKQP